MQHQYRQNPYYYGKSPLFFDTKVSMTGTALTHAADVPIKCGSSNSFPISHDGTLLGRTVRGVASRQLLGFYVEEIAPWLIRLWASDVAMVSCQTCRIRNSYLLS